jgi:acyl-coenzyme A thioesterase PaaI-like protein
MTIEQSGPSAQPNDRCIVCGSRNPRGLQLCFAPDGDHAVAARWRTEEAWEGFRGVIHGGIVSTVLDEAMSKAVAAAGIPALTCELRVRLRHHVKPSEELRVRGWMVDRQRRRILTEASLKDRDGAERAHAWGTFLPLQQ